MTEKKKHLYIIAGANGSGKSTLASELLPEENLEFLNADDIAKEICPENIESVRITAGRKVLKKLDNLFESKKSFAIETTLAGNNHIETIKKAKELKYNIALIYSFVENPEICINRIKVRVLNGGHNIPDEDVIRRFYRSKNNFWNKYKDIVDEWNLFYNGVSDYILVAKQELNGIEILNDALYNEFIKDIK
jgi:predicted ABC-type ATPase